MNIWLILTKQKNTIQIIYKKCTNPLFLLFRPACYIIISGIKKKKRMHFLGIYSLKSLAPILDAMCDWGTGYLEHNL